MSFFNTISLKYFLTFLLFCFGTLSFAQQKPLANSIDNFEESKEILWKDYLKDVQNLVDLKKEFDVRALKFEDKIMRFSLNTIGVEPKDGYPLYIALHGGGQGPSIFNDFQWRDMQTYYLASVKTGIYIATRGITDTWKLHWEDKSFPLYDKLIESAILFNHVDPNKIYILGFSAGGDGVYQITPRMAARFAAANMSAGHHNWVTFDNLHNTPLLLQVGELDSAYDRNKVAVENYLILNGLANKYGSGFIHNVFVHYKGSHNSWRDNDPTYSPQVIIKNPEAWLKQGDRSTDSINTNAIDWMSHYTRNPLAEKIVWDLSVGAESRTYQTGALLNHSEKLAKPYELFHWLDVSQNLVYPKSGKLVVEISKTENAIKVLKVKDVTKFRVLLNPNLLDLNKAISVFVNNQLIGTVTAKEELSVMKRTLLERSDKNEIYDAEIMLNFNNNNNRWEINSTN